MKSVYAKQVYTTTPLAHAQLPVDEVIQRTLRGEFEDGALQLAVLRAAQQGLL